MIQGRQRSGKRSKISSGELRDEPFLEPSPRPLRGVPEECSTSQTDQGSRKRRYSTRDLPPLSGTESNLFTPEESSRIRDEYEIRKRAYSLRGEDILKREDEYVADFAAATMGVLWDSMGSRDPVISQTPWYQCLYGDSSSAGLFVIKGKEAFINLHRTDEIDAQELYLLTESEKLDAEAVVRELCRNLGTVNLENLHRAASLKAVSAAAAIYKNLTNASVDVRVLQRNLCDAGWVTKRPQLNPVDMDPQTLEWLRPLMLDRACAFACIAMFETGRYDINPFSLSNVFAISSEDSIYVGAALLCDPSEEPHAGDIKRVLGNIGQPGVAFLVPPLAPMIKEVSVSEWPKISRHEFNGQIQNHFESTSLHLSFTGASAQVDVGFSGSQDTEVYMLETLISVHDSGRWIADLDIYKSFRSDRLDRLAACHNAIHRAPGGTSAPITRFTCIDDWLELVDPPKEKRSLVRAHKNWQARLAAAALSITLNYNTIVIPEKVCWECFEDMVGSVSASRRVIAIA